MAKRRSVELMAYKGSDTPAGYLENVNETGRISREAQWPLAKLKRQREVHTRG